MQFITNNQRHFSQNYNKHILNLYEQHKRPQIAKTILRKKNKAGGIRVLDFRLYYEFTAIHLATAKPKKKRWKKLTLLT